jgi:flagellar hook-associated protein 3 FlgL
MRIATSTLFDQQTTSLDNLQSQYLSVGNTLTSGLQVNQPSDAPGQIAQDLSVRTAVATETQDQQNISTATGQLTTTDGALSTLTSILQSARSLAVQGATDSLSAQQRSAIGSQVDQLLQESIGVANTQYGGAYIFAGSANVTSAPVTAQNSPTSAVSFSGNNEAQGALQVAGQTIPLSSTLQEAFNYDAANGSQDVFTVLQTLRDTLNNGTVVDSSSAPLNTPGNSILTSTTPGGPPLASTLGNAPLATPLTADSNGNYAITITGAGANGTNNTVQLTFNANTPIDDGSATSVVGQINAASAQTGVTARFDQRSQSLVLSGTGSFYVKDVPSTTGGTASNFTTAFGLAPQADTVQNLSTQLGAIDTVLNQALAARSTVGSRLNALTSAGSQIAQTSTDNTTVQSSIEDTNVASAVSRFSQIQTALQAAYTTTNKLEGKSLIDYIS